MSWKPEVEVDGQWSQNNLAFATKAEAETSAHDLHNRWLLCTGWRAIESDEPVNYQITGGELVAVEPLVEVEGHPV